MTDCERKFGKEYYELYCKDPAVECKACSEPSDTVVDTSVNHPEHYTSGSVECIEAIRSALTLEEFRGFIKGVVIKYAWREKLKGGDEDLAKARWYINCLLKKEGK